MFLYRKAASAVVLAFAVLGFGAMQSRADTITTFLASGSFDSGSTLSGTLAVDTTTGSATAVDLVVSAPASLTFDSIQYQTANYAGTGTYDIQTGTAAGGLPNLNFALASPLIGYTGGSLGSEHDLANGLLTWIYYSSTHQDRLVVGSLTPVPEPASAALLSLGGLLGLGLVRRKIAG